MFKFSFTRFFCFTILLVVVCNATAQKTIFFTANKDSTRFSLTLAGSSHLASLPLKCLQQEYPNKTSHTSTGISDHVLTPKQQHPAFYGCFDWHSCVHGHWMLVRLLKDFPTMPEAGNIRAAIAKNITAANIQQEIQYFRLPLSRSFERTYGWAWLLKLQEELLTWNDPDAVTWRKTLQPLCDTVINLWMNYLPKQTYPNRTGVHPNTAFGLGFALDYARTAHQLTFETAIKQSVKQLYLKDKNAPTIWEPDGTDFLSPSLEEADLVRKVLSKEAFANWLSKWLNKEALEHLTRLPVVSDRTDLQIVHLDGLCFSRSWCMKGIANHLPAGDARKKLLLRSAIQHLNASLPNVATGNYGGEHWLASFAVYAIVNE